MTGKFIVIEGLEGAGKTTAINTVATILNRHNICNLQFTREPGGTPIAEALRNIIKNGLDHEPLTNKAELLMLYAARIQLIDNVIKPSLKSGKWVIGDRHDLSTQAYQGGGRQLNTVLIETLKNQVLGNFKPDLTIYLDIDPEIGLMRAKSRGKLDRIEQQSLLFFKRIRQRYQELAKQDNTIITIDAEKTMENVNEQIEKILVTWLTKQVDIT